MAVSKKKPVRKIKKLTDEQVQAVSGGSYFNECKNQYTCYWLSIKRSDEEQQK